MLSRRLLPMAAIALAAAAGFTPASAAAKGPKTISKSYDMTLVPFPSPAMGTPTCKPTEGQEGVTKHTETLVAPKPGLLKVEVSGFDGDWDISVFDSAGKTLGVGSGTSTGAGAPQTNAKDTAKVKIKKAETVLVVTCNFVGSPQASGKYTFTY